VAAFPDVPGYELQAELGRGGMAVVYSAIENDLGRQVAIKVVRGDAGDADGHIQRLENEARGLAALHHPHIVDLYRFGRTADGALYYVMPLMTGGSLEDWQKPVPEERVVALLDTLLDALGHAHAADIVHRDIKPANILFDRHKRPLLADFGAAFMRQRATRITSHGTAIGSSGYMSPEQARGLAVDARSDLYSTAVLAFELLTGKLPFEGSDGLATALAQLEQPVPRLPDPLRHWQAFFYRALAVNPEHRYGSAAAMRAAIHKLKPSTRPRWRRPLVAIALVAGVIAIGALAFTTWRSRDHVDALPAVTGKVSSKHAAASAKRAQEPAPAVPAEPAVANTKATITVGDRFADAGGPELVVAQAAKGSHRGLAVMAAPLSSSLYRRYATARGRKPVSCAGMPAAGQGCLDLASANDVASWLSKVTGERYRVPTRAELGASLARVAAAPANAWTSTCNEVRVARPENVARRSWERVRKWVGKPKPVHYDLRCEGHFTLKLDHRNATAEVRSRPAPDTVVVLVREIR
jgi:hypothetical protein